MIVPFRNVCTLEDLLHAHLLTRSFVLSFESKWNVAHIHVNIASFKHLHRLVVSYSIFSSHRTKRMKLNGRFRSKKDLTKMRSNIATLKFQSYCCLIRVMFGICQLNIGTYRCDHRMKLNWIRTLAMKKKLARVWVCVSLPYIYWKQLVSCSILLAIYIRFVFYRKLQSFVLLRNKNTF